MMEVRDATIEDLEFLKAMIWEDNFSEFATDLPDKAWD